MGVCCGGEGAESVVRAGSEAALGTEYPSENTEREGR